MALEKKSKKQYMKDLEAYYKSLKLDEIAEIIDMTTNRLKILLNVRLEKRNAINLIDQQRKELELN